MEDQTKMSLMEHLAVNQTQTHARWDLHHNTLSTCENEMHDDEV
uniref:Uncharacterized protein n=1 Tax=Ascaris lumbricoides TaxID=6252 RepID=A0A0M3IS69_ASCLU